jgi:uncharacterized alkaline shock family protein YloU
LNIILRILLWLYAAGVATASVAVLLQYAGLRVLDYRVRITEEGALVAVIFLLISIFFLLYRTSGHSDREPETVVHKLDHGDVRITYNTIEQLATRAALKIRGVKDLKTRVRMQEGGAMHIAIRFAIEADLDIPKTTAELQQAVKEYVESTSGIPITEVTVYVTELAAPPEVVKKRVE